MVKRLTRGGVVLKWLRSRSVKFLFSIIVYLVPPGSSSKPTFYSNRCWNAVRSWLA